MIKDIYELFLKEFRLELRRRSVIAGIALYLLCLVFIAYISFALRHEAIHPITWSALYWLIVLFAVINSLAKSFIGEKKGLSLYYYTLARAEAIIISKILYNSILCFLLSVIAYILFATFIDNAIDDHVFFIETLALTSIGFAASLSLISAIAAKANHSNILMAVLSFPILISILLMAIRITKNILDSLERSASYDELFNLFAINCILAGLAYALFPYIWRS